MITLRPAQEGDRPVISSIVEDLDIGHSSARFENFIVATDDSRIVGVANLEDCGPCYYLSAVGVARRYQRTGAGGEFMRKLLFGLKKDVYLYSRIPEFFARFGFVEAEAPAQIPGREIYGCKACEDFKNCMCMVRKQDAA